MPNPRWKRRPPGSTWGDWGPDDQLGRLNLLTPAKVLKGVAEVKEGRVFCLPIPLDYRGGGTAERGEHIGAMALGIENMAAHGVQGRGVMIDLEAHFGRGEKFVGYDELMRIMEADKVEVGEGDLVCFRTGYDRVILGMNKHPHAATPAANPCGALAGVDERILTWITKTGIVALISDNRAVEASPSRPCE